MAGDTARRRKLSARPDESIAGEPAGSGFSFWSRSSSTDRFHLVEFHAAAHAGDVFTSAARFIDRRDPLAGTRRVRLSRYNAKPRSSILLGAAGIVIKLVFYRWNSHRAVVKSVEAARFITPSRGESSFY